MNLALSHRGPDDEGVMVEPKIGLAMRRLSIIDLEHGRQPMANETGEIHVVQNGEIYNFVEIRERLQEQGHEFATHSDTEVLVHLYEERGVEFARELRGMFAVAIWDGRRKRLVLARDRYGIKPLLYTVCDGVLAFSSELKSLLQYEGVSRQLSPDSLRQYLMFNWVPGSGTIFEDIGNLPPGHVLVARDGAIRVHQFAGPTSGGAAGQTPSGDDDLLAEELLTRLRDSVRAHLVADVPVGVLLSGGVDSSMLTALAAEHTPHLKTFSIGFDDPRFNELPRARLLAQRYATDHHELVVDPDMTTLLPRLVETFDQPLGDSSTVPAYLVSELAAREVKVVLAGEGGDELFGGYNYYAADRLSRWIGPLAGLARPLIERLPEGSSRYPDRMKRFSRGAALSPMARHCSWLEVWSQETIDRLLEGSRTASGATTPLTAFETRYAESAQWNWLTRLQDLDVGSYLVDDLLMKADLASMAHSLEVRVPFLDTAIADFAYGLQPKHKIRGLQKKWLLKRAAAKLVPPEVLAAPKQGFSIPAAAWLRDELREYATDTLSEAVLRRQGFFDSTVVHQLFREHLESRQDHSRSLWGLMMFTLWADRFGVTAS